jgi:hypothetical protein
VGVILILLLLLNHYPARPSEVEGYLVDANEESREEHLGHEDDREDGLRGFDRVKRRRQHRCKRGRCHGEQECDQAQNEKVPVQAH